MHAEPTVERLYLDQQRSKRSEEEKRQRRSLGCLLLPTAICTLFGREFPRQNSPKCTSLEDNAAPSIMCNLRGEQPCHHRDMCHRAQCKPSVETTLPHHSRQPCIPACEQRGPTCIRECPEQSNTLDMQLSVNFVSRTKYTGNRTIPVRPHTIGPSGMSSWFASGTAIASSCALSMLIANPHELRMHYCKLSRAFVSCSYRQPHNTHTHSPFPISKNAQGRIPT
jgi:hypothetical protein